MFKELLGKEENKEVLAFLLSTYFSLDYNYVLNNIKYFNTNLKLDSVKDYKYDVDIIISLNGKTVINIEMNKSFWKGVEKRNLAYITKIYGNQYEKGKGNEQFKESKKHIQINFNNYNYPLDRIRSIGRIKDIETNEEITDVIEIHNVNLEVIRKKCYNEKEELNNIEKVGKFLISKEKEEIEKIVGEEMENIIDKVLELSSDKELIGIYDKEELQKEIEEGIREAGKEEGILQNKQSIAITMLNKNFDIDTIIEITGLTKEQIDKLKSNI